MPPRAPVYQLEVTLEDSRPPIWRRILVPGNITLPRLHRVLQAVMGWEDYHLHQFMAGGKRYSIPHPDDWVEVTDERRVPLSRLLREPGDRLEYEYDFGDGWRHRVVLEEVLPDLELAHPVCLAGERAGPPEDSGGVWGYQEMLEAVRDRAHPDYKQYREWLRDGFDPEEFPLEAINQELRRVR